MMTDYHCHALPHMDDGAKDVGQSLGMLNLLKEQGVGRVVATPHFYRHRESARRFLERRDTANGELAGQSPVPVLLGAEVRIEPGLSEEKDLRRMTLGGGRYLLLELPYTAYKPWMVEEVCNVCYTHGLTPVMAHVDRYTAWYGKQDLWQILSIPEAVIQVNNEALFARRTLKFVLNLIGEGYPVVFGSDSHDLGERAPNFSEALAVLRSKLKPEALSRLTTLNAGLLE